MRRVRQGAGAGSVDFCDAHNFAMDVAASGHWQRRKPHFREQYSHASKQQSTRQNTGLLHVYDDDSNATPASTVPHPSSTTRTQHSHITIAKRTRRGRGVHAGAARCCTSRATRDLRLIQYGAATVKPTTAPPSRPFVCACTRTRLQPTKTVHQATSNGRSRADHARRPSGHCLELRLAVELGHPTQHAFPSASPTPVSARRGRRLRLPQWLRGGARHRPLLGLVLVTRRQISPLLLLAPLHLVRSRRHGPVRLHAPDGDAGTTVQSFWRQC